MPENDFMKVDFYTASGKPISVFFIAMERTDDPSRGKMRAGWDDVEVRDHIKRFMLARLNEVGKKRMAKKIEPFFDDAFKDFITLAQGLLKSIPNLDQVPGREIETRL